MPCFSGTKSDMRFWVQEIYLEVITGSTIGQWSPEREPGRNLEDTLISRLPLQGNGTQCHGTLLIDSMEHPQIVPPKEESWSIYSPNPRSHNWSDSCRLPSLWAYLGKRPKCWWKKPFLGARVNCLGRDTKVTAPGVRVALLEQAIFSKKFKGPKHRIYR